jgi:type VI secretion system protein ImpL
VAGGNRTVLIYGGSLASEPEQNTALRKLRRGRPLDDYCARMPQSLNLTPNQRQRFTRLEKISELLRYSAPVWLWQLCDSKWSQAKRTEQPVEAVSRWVPKLTILAASRLMPLLAGAGREPGR